MESKLASLTTSEANINNDLTTEDDDEENVFCDPCEDVNIPLNEEEEEEEDEEEAVENVTNVNIYIYIFYKILN